MGRLKPEGIETTPGFVSWNGNSGLSAISLAYHFGVRKIVLIGFDMKVRNGETNFHRDHEKMGLNHKRKDLESAQKDYVRFLRRTKAIAADAKRLKMEIVNATPDSAIEVFPFVDLKEAV